MHAQSTQDNSDCTERRAVLHPKESLKLALPSPQALQTVLQTVKCTEPTYHQSRAWGICCIPWWGSQSQAGMLCHCHAGRIHDPGSTSWGHKSYCYVWPGMLGTSSVQLQLRFQLLLKLCKMLIKNKYITEITSTCSCCLSWLNNLHLEEVEKWQITPADSYKFAHTVA